ncbi:pentatricopeptide repeat-containing protein At4g02750-like [Andrographis paniculata]|uniref:pentatricopeptide repeat-containing protein At4g02750-like n=1 Tax=Andrographis paniculata TaxID=175694 RepID=UPI0021E9451F|nr:pentatricopeptide repeat-containing protein At4g02750-like [Andrographis paniculata]
MSRSLLRPEYFDYLRRSLKVASNSPSFIVAWKHQHWNDNLLNPSKAFDVVTTNKAITFRCQTGEIDVARHLFDTMPERTTVSWNTMITGYSNWKMVPEALGLISLMHHSDVKLNETTFSMSLSLCGRAQLLAGGKQIHGLVIKSEHRRFKFVGSALLFMYANCLEIADGHKVFDELRQENELLWSLMLAGYVECNLMSEAVSVFERMPRQGVVEWTTLIAGYVKSEGGCKKALEMFKMMRSDCQAVPNEFTLDCVVRACAILEDMPGGRAIHGLVVKVGVESECSIGTSLIFLYWNCKSRDDAKKVYGGMFSPSLNASNELIRGLIKLGQVDEAELIFSKMAERNPVSYHQMIKGYAMCGQVVDAERLFSQMPVRLLTSLNTMISVYTRNGDMDRALDLFEKVKGEGNPVTWNSMITGYVHNDQHEKALQLYLTMHGLSISRTRSTFSVLFQACACLGSLRQAEVFHAHLEKTPFSSNVYVGTALINMYSKCGSIASTRAAFRCITSPNVAAWTALINGHADHGLGSGAISLFKLMLERDVVPNAATFVAVLSACARAGFLKEGLRYFHQMEEQYGISPSLEHFTCVVDLLGRTGLVHEAEEFIEGMPMEADKVLLNALLHACWFWMDMRTGERVARKMFALDPNPSPACVMMSNMYSSSGKWGQHLKMRDILKEWRVNKDPGCSWIDVNNRTHVFSVDYRSHPKTDMIYSILKSLKVNTLSTQVTGSCIPE